MPNIVSGMYVGSNPGLPLMFGAGVGKKHSQKKSGIEIVSPEQASYLLTDRNQALQTTFRRIINNVFSGMVKQLQESTQKGIVRSRNISGHVDYLHEVAAALIRSWIGMQEQLAQAHPKSRPADSNNGLKLMGEAIRQISKLSEQWLSHDSLWTDDVKSLAAQNKLMKILNDLNVLRKSYRLPEAEGDFMSCVKDRQGN